MAITNILLLLDHSVDSATVGVDREDTMPTSSQCPHLEEFERCDNTVIDCLTYTWRWATWSTCLLPDSVPGATAEHLSGVVTPCGTGRRFRYVECVRSDGQVVAEQFCRQHLPVCTIIRYTCVMSNFCNNSQILDNFQNLILSLLKRGSNFQRCELLTSENGKMC